MNPSNDLIDLTFEILRHVRKKMVCAPVKDVRPVNFLQMHGLFIISEHEGLTMKELSEHMKVSAPTSTSFVNRLVRSKWIERVSDDKNRKLVRLRLTATGKEVLKEKMQERRGLLHGIVSLLSEQDQKDLARIYRNLLTSLSRHHE